MEPDLVRFASMDAYDGVEGSNAVTLPTWSRSMQISSFSNDFILYLVAWFFYLLLFLLQLLQLGLSLLGRLVLSVNGLLEVFDQHEQFLQAGYGVFVCSS